jgi:hypothetical protein
MAGFGGSNFSAVGEAAMYASATANDSYTPMRGAESGMTAFNSYGGASYQLRCVKEEVAANAAPVGAQTGRTAVLMGDSITEQWPIRGRKEFFTENNYEGVGISGQTSRDMLDRFYKDVLSKSPQVVVVAAGTNDLAWNDGVKTCREDILNNVMMMIELSRAWGSEVVVGSSFPSRHYWWNDGNANWNLTPDQVAQGALDLWTILKAYADEKAMHLPIITMCLRMRKTIWPIRIAMSADLSGQVNLIMCTLELQDMQRWKKSSSRLSMHCLTIRIRLFQVDPIWMIWTRLNGNLNLL